jgi:hypothetical protein
MQRMTSTASDEWSPWPVSWSAAWVGALTSLAAALVLGLVAAAAGAGSVRTIASFHRVPVGDLIAAVFVSFLAFVAGGWVCGKISGFRHAEPAMLHGAISWLLALPLLVAALGLGAGSAFGAWYGGLVTPLGTTPTVPATPDAVRHAALAALTAILLGLVGSAIGAWLATGEPMNFRYYRTREAIYRLRKGMTP